MTFLWNCPSCQLQTTTLCTQDAGPKDGILDVCPQCKAFLTYQDGSWHEMTDGEVAGLDTEDREYLETLKVEGDPEAQGLAEIIGGSRFLSLAFFGFKLIGAAEWFIVRAQMARHLKDCLKERSWSMAWVVTKAIFHK